MKLFRRKEGLKIRPCLVCLGFQVLVKCFLLLVTTLWTMILIDIGQWKLYYYSMEMFVAICNSRFMWLKSMMISRIILVSSNLKGWLSVICRAISRLSLVWFYVMLVWISLQLQLGVSWSWWKHFSWEVKKCKIWSLTKWSKAIAIV